ncbi:uncharacterized protein H6S33_000588 [Morchella sextelata]|uniref:uncharacterized protein n=1 Tax=Morchella sextelata TaxID=1174677 RepID=UPI001D046DB4|nr:uncharacterized protein H6S33_000588 [Morchella sextelata]KAH0614952.1 hypothetical protein H6S33_000588 [Morchella sextelata]
MSKVNNVPHSGNPERRKKEPSSTRRKDLESFHFNLPLLPSILPPTGYGWSMALTGHRQVGQALKHLPSSNNNDAQGNTVVFHNGNVPWQRVISSNGVIPIR